MINFDLFVLKNYTTCKLLHLINYLNKKKIKYNSAARIKDI